MMVNKAEMVYLPSCDTGDWSMKSRCDCHAMVQCKELYDRHWVQHVLCCLLNCSGCVLGLEQHLDVIRHMELLIYLILPRSFLCPVRMWYRLLWVDGVAWCESKASSNWHAFVCVCLCSVCMCFPKLMESLHLIGSEHLARITKNWTMQIWVQS